jgi:hypothetical protein
MQKQVCKVNESSILKIIWGCHIKYQKGSHFIKRVICGWVLISNLVFLNSSYAQNIKAQAIPAWTNGKQFEDKDYYYFVIKVSSDRANCNTCYEEARKSAMLEMVRTLFGTTSKFRVNTFENAHNDEKVPLMNLNTFRERGRYFNISIKELDFIFQFSKAEYLKVKSLSEKRAGDIDELIESSGTSGTGVLIVKSEPSNANVIIDGNIMGQTPLILKNKISAGEHFLLIEHPLAESFTQKLLTTSGTFEVNQVLNPAKMLVTFNCNISDAELFVDGKYIGLVQNPIEFKVKKDGNLKYQIQIKHKDAFTLEKTIHFEKNAELVDEVSLQLKSSKVYFYCNKYPCKISYDGNNEFEIKKPEIRSFKSGKYTFTANAENYEPDIHSEIFGGGLNSILKFNFTTLKEIPTNNQNTESEPVSEPSELQPEVVEEVSQIENKKDFNKYDIHQSLYLKFEGNKAPYLESGVIFYGLGYKLGSSINKDFIYWIGFNESILKSKKYTINEFIILFEIQYKLSAKYNLLYQYGFQEISASLFLNKRNYTINSDYYDVGVQYTLEQNPKYNVYVNLGYSHSNSPYRRYTSIDTVVSNFGFEF